MENIKRIFADNLIAVRKANHLTQSALAQKLNYSDKTVSKWERAEALPDVETLVQLSELFGVSPDWFLDPESHNAVSYDESEEARRIEEEKKVLFNRSLISCMAVVSVLLLATLIFIYGIISTEAHVMWRAYIWAIPTSSVILMLFFYKWRAPHLYFLITQSILVWSMLLSIYLQLRIYAFWYLFLAGIPVQALLFLNHLLKTH